MLTVLIALAFSLVCGFQDKATAAFPQEPVGTVTGQASQAGDAGTVSPSKADPGEREVLEFVGQYQPKLRELLEFLKKKDPLQYQQAYKEMARAKQRLSNLEKRDQQLFEVELKLWRTRSELRLLAAEISVAPQGRQQKLEQRLEELVKLQVAAELARLKVQRERTARQLLQFDTQISERESGTAAHVARIIKQWKNHIEKQTSRKSAK